MEGVVCGEIRFDEIVPGAAVRVITVPDGTQYLSVRDLIMHACDKIQRDATSIWATLPADESCVRLWRFHGRGQVDQPVITFPCAIALLAALPGEHIKRTRSKVARILTMHFTGDPSLVPDTKESWVEGLDRVHHELECVKTSVESFVSAAEERAANAEAKADEATKQAAQALDRAISAEAKLLETDTRLAQALDRATRAEAKAERLDTLMEQAAASLAVLQQEMDKKRKWTE